MTFSPVRSASFAALLYVSSFGGPAMAQAPSTAQALPSAQVAPDAVVRQVTPSQIKIGNFGKINDGYFRGAQPKARDYADLAAMGIRTVIDLQADGRADEPGLVKRAGMAFFRIGMTTTARPTEAQIAEFFSIVNDPANQPVFVHCAGGRHRTGTMTALYRMTQDGWDADRAYSEMKQFHFEGFPDHPVLRKFVYAYKPVPVTPTPTVLATTIATKE